MSAGHVAELRVIENARAIGSGEGVLETSPSSLEKIWVTTRRAFTGETLDPASCFVLAEAESRGIELFRHHVTVNYLDARYVLGERLSAAQRRFNRACETLARVRKLSRNTAALQSNIATSEGQQVNLAK